MELIAVAPVFLLLFIVPELVRIAIDAALGSAPVCDGSVRGQHIVESTALPLLAAARRQAG